MRVFLACTALVCVVSATPASAQAPVRMGPIPADGMTDAQAKAAKDIERNGAVPGYLWPLLRNPGLAQPTQEIGEYLNRQGTLPPKLTQMVILIISRRLAYNGSWIEHSGMADRAGLRADIVQAIAADRRPASMDEDETLVYEMCDDLQKTMTIGQATYTRAVAKFGEAGVVDTVATYGFYYYLGLLNNATRLPAGASPVFRMPAVR